MIGRLQSKEGQSYSEPHSGEEQNSERPLVRHGTYTQKASASPVRDARRTSTQRMDPLTGLDIIKESLSEESRQLKERSQSSTLSPKSRKAINIEKATSSLLS